MTIATIVRVLEALGIPTTEPDRGSPTGPHKPRHEPCLATGSEALDPRRRLGELGDLLQGHTPLEGNIPPTSSALGAVGQST